MENLVAFILLLERSVMILAYPFYCLPGYGFIMRFKVYFGVSSRSKLIKLLFLDCFVRIEFRVFCYIRVKRKIISHEETNSRVLGILGH